MSATANRRTDSHAPGEPWTLAEAARYLKVSQRTLSRLNQAGRLRLIRVGTRRGRVLVPDAEVQRIAAEGV
jgi:excisionase family DNA binding protein